mgnify:CR=1 FL=1
MGSIINITWASFEHIEVSEHIHAILSSGQSTHTLFSIFTKPNFPSLLLLTSETIIILFSSPEKQVEIVSESGAGVDVYSCPPL